MNEQLRNNNRVGLVNFTLSSLLPIQIIIYPTHEAELMNLKAAHPWDHRHYGGGEGGGKAFVCVDRAEFAASRRNIYAVAQTALSAKSSQNKDLLIQLKL